MGIKDFKWNNFRHQLSKVLAFGNDYISFLTSDFIFFYIKMNLYNKVYKIKAINSGNEAGFEYMIKLILIKTKKRQQNN